jgi:hypothetical protein
MRLLSRAVTGDLKNNPNDAIKHFLDKSALNLFYKMKIRAKLVL